MQIYIPFYKFILAMPNSQSLYFTPSLRVRKCVSKVGWEWKEGSKIAKQGNGFGESTGAGAITEYYDFVHLS